MTSDGESNRARVRRILIEPLQQAGMCLQRRKGETPADTAERERRYLNGLCDELGYCSDRTLDQLLSWGKVSGEGPKRRHWPARLTFLHHAQAVQPLPVEAIPALASWFGSVAGPRAMAEGRVIGEFLFIQRYRRPPINDDERRTVALRNGALVHDQERLRDLVRLGRADQADRDMLTWLDDIERRAVDLIEAGEETRAESEAV